MGFDWRLTSAFAMVACSLSACSFSTSGIPQTPDASERSGERADPSIAAYIGSHPARHALAKSWLDKATFRRMISTPGPHYIVYAANYFDGSVDLYQYNTYQSAHSSQKPFGQLAVPAAGLAVDAAQDVFVVDTQDEVIDEYTPGSMPQVAASFPSPKYPQGIAVGPDGSVYVSSDGYGSYPNGSVTVYKKGATTPFETLTLPPGSNAYYVAVDRANNVYVSYGPTSEEQFLLGEFKANSTTFTPLALANDTYGVRLDGAGNLLSVNPVTRMIDVYDNGTTTPVRSLPLTDYRTYFDLTYARDGIFAVGFKITGVSEFAYPAGSAEAAINSSGPNYLYGIAVAPAAPYPPPFLP